MDRIAGTSSTPTVVVIAPYAPDAEAWDLGAGQKIRLVLAAFTDAGYDVHFVDSSHQTCEWAMPLRGRSHTSHGASLHLWRPLRLPWRPVGKLFNYLCLHAFDRALADVQPDFVWVYNSYAYEARLALRIAKLRGCRLILQLEDLPSARSRGLSPKPWLDAQYLPRLLARATTVTYVNDDLVKKYSNQSRRSALLPSILGQDLAELRQVPRFQTTDVTVGYFGGLTVEKGADQVLDVMAHLPAHFRFITTGRGPLEQQFRATAEAHPERLQFEGVVSRARLVELMRRCDVILNPHQSIVAMDHGVFPFKVFEGIASGALVVSTVLPSVDQTLDGAVTFYDGTVDGLTRHLLDARDYYLAHREAGDGVRQAIWDRYSFEAFNRRLSAIIGASAGRSET